MESRRVFFVGQMYPTKFNSSPLEKWWLEDYFSIGMVAFHVVFWGEGSVPRWLSPLIVVVNEFWSTAIFSQTYCRRILLVTHLNNTNTTSNTWNFPRWNICCTRKIDLRQGLALLTWSFSKESRLTKAQVVGTLVFMRWHWSKWMAHIPKKSKFSSDLFFGWKKTGFWGHGVELYSRCFNFASPGMFSALSMIVIHMDNHG